MQNLRREGPRMRCVRGSMRWEEVGGVGPQGKLGNYFKEEKSTVPTAAEKPTYTLIFSTPNFPSLTSSNWGTRGENMFEGADRERVMGKQSHKGHFLFNRVVRNWKVLSFLLFSILFTSHGFSECPSRRVLNCLSFTLCCISYAP